MFQSIQELEKFLKAVELAYPFTEELFPGWNTFDAFGKKKFGVTHQAKRICVLAERMMDGSPAFFIRGSRTAHDHARKLVVAATRLALFAEVPRIQLLLRSSKRMNSEAALELVRAGFTRVALACVAASEPLDKMRFGESVAQDVLENRVERVYDFAIVYAHAVSFTLVDLEAFLQAKVAETAV